MGIQICLHWNFSDRTNHVQMSNGIKMPQEQQLSSFIDLAKKLRDQKERKKIEEEKKKPIWILQIDLMDKILYNKIDNHEDT